MARDVFYTLYCHCSTETPLLNNPYTSKRTTRSPFSAIFYAMLQLRCFKPIIALLFVSKLKTHLPPTATFHSFFLHRNIGNHQRKSETSVKNDRRSKKKTLNNTRIQQMNGRMWCWHWLNALNLFIHLTGSTNNNRTCGLW